MNGSTEQAYAVAAHRGRDAVLERCEPWRWDCINARQRKRAKWCRVAPGTSLLTSPCTRRASRNRGAVCLQPWNSLQRQTRRWRKPDSNRRSRARRATFRAFSPMAVHFPKRLHRLVLGLRVRIRLPPAKSQERTCLVVHICMDGELPFAAARNSHYCPPMTISATGNRMFESALLSFRRRFPEVDVQISSGLFPVAIVPLREGQTDIVIGPRPPADQLSRRFRNAHHHGFCPQQLAVA